MNSKVDQLENQQDLVDELTDFSRTSESVNKKIKRLHCMKTEINL